MEELKDQMKSKGACEEEHYLSPDPRHLHCPQLGPLCQNVPYQMGLQAGDRLLQHRDQGAPKIPEIQWKVFFMPNGAAKEQPEKCIFIYLLSFLVL